MFHHPSAFGVLTEEEAARVEREYRRRDAERLDIQASSGDLHALKERIFSPENPLPEANPATGKEPG